MVKFVIKDGQVYRQESWEGGSVEEACGPEYRVMSNKGVKSWERFNVETGAYVPAPEHTEPFPPDPMPSPEDRISKLETENTAMKAVIDELLMGGTS